MLKWPAPNANGKGKGSGSGNGDGNADIKARYLVAALLSSLRLAEAPDLPGEERAQHTSAATRQATMLRDLFHGRLVIVVTRDKAAQREQIRRAFPADADVEVVVDRRHGERRRGTSLGIGERRREDRRQRRVDEELRRVGAAVVPARPVSLAVNGGSVTAGPAVPSSEYRVLLIDDDPAILHLLSNYFELDKRYSVKAAMSGEKGLSAFEDDRPDVVLLDISMPGMDGLEVLQRMRKIDPSIPVIMVTGASYQQSGEALKQGAFAYIPKPFDLRYIDHLISLVTDRKRPPRR
ncbi:MAG: response regulator [Candidatus Rokuibacteriota bacterium]